MLLRSPTRVVPFESTPARRAPCGQGLALALLNLAFATVVAVSTYYLNLLANTHVGLGLNVETFTSNQFNIPVNVLLQGSVTFPLATPLPLNATLSLSTLLYKGCSKKDVACASAFLPATNHLWSAVAKTFANISNFELPVFQDPTQNITIQHINNLAAWNKPTVQFYISGHDIAITCMVRRASFYPATSSPSSAEIDSIAFCSQRKFDPNWICENQVATDAPSYAIQVSRGAANYLGVAPRHDIYMNPGFLATFTGGPLGAVRLGPVPAIDEFEGGILQIMAPWDIVPFGDCSTLNPATGLGWLMQMAGFVTMYWKSDALMLTNCIVLWLLTLYLVLLQVLFLRHSVICSVPVYMAKNVAGLVILFVGFHGNANLQTLTTYLHQTPSFNLGYYVYCGPAQMASIVGIMTGTLIQMWFNPRLVTQTWLLIAFSLFNWILVFVLEAFVFPGMSSSVPGPCALATSTGCLQYTAVKRNHYLSAVASGGVVLFAIGCVYVVSHKQRKTRHVVPSTHSVLTYLRVLDLQSTVTSLEGCLQCNTAMSDGVGIDAGILLMKNMLQVSDTVLTRTSNVQYELIYRLLPTKFLKRLYSFTVGTMLVVHIEKRALTRVSSYKYLHEMDIGGGDGLSGYFA